MQIRITVGFILALVMAVATGGGLTYYKGRSHGVDSTNSHWEAKMTKAKAEAALKQQRLEATAAMTLSEVRIENEKLVRLNTAAINKSERLLQQFADQCNRIARPTSNTTDSTASVPVRVFERLLDRARQYARHADEARTAGLACEKQYKETQKELRQWQDR